MAARVRQLWRSMGEPSDFTVVEPGAGRSEMADAFAEWRYVPVDLDFGELPEKFHGVVFANEFFDALPVEAAVFAGGEFRERRVALAGDDVRLERRRRGLPRSGAIPAPLVSAAGRGPLLRSQPECSGLDGTSADDRYAVVTC